MRSIDPRPQCAGENPHKGRQPDCGFSEAGAAEGGGAHTVCYVPYSAPQNFPQYVIKNIDQRMRSAVWFYRLYDNGELKKHSGAMVGNKVAAWRTDQRLDEIFAASSWDVEKTLFITLTHQYIKTEKGRQESWLYYQKELPRFLRKLKSRGMVDFFTVKEAHTDGGCHVHLLCLFKEKLLFFRYKEKRRLANKALREFIKDNWAGDVDIEGLSGVGAKDYIKKYVGKYSHIEDALRRAKRGWSAEGDERHRKADYKKLWTNYYCSKLKVRRFTGKTGKHIEKETAKPSDLVNNMNNSTAANKPVVIKEWIASWGIKSHPAFEPVNGVVEAHSREYILVMRNLQGVQDG